MKRPAFLLASVLVFSCSSGEKWSYYRGSIDSSSGNCRVSGGDNYVFDIRYSYGALLLPWFSRGYRALISVPSARLSPGEVVRLGDAGVEAVYCLLSGNDLGVQQPLHGEVELEEELDGGLLVRLEFAGLDGGTTFDRTMPIIELPLPQE